MSGGLTGAQSPFAFEIVEAPPPIDHLISHFFEFRAEVERLDDVERADMPQIRFMISGHGHGKFADGIEQHTSKVFVLGPTTAPFDVTLFGPVFVFGITLYTAGWVALVGIDASLMTNRVINAHDLYGDRILDLCDRMEAAPDFPARMALVTEFIEATVVTADGAATDFTRTVDRWLQSSFSPDVEALLATTKLSRRQVERNCKQYYGLTPKMLARKYRALRVAIALSRGDATADDCLGYGFYDQSHMIREIKHFTGTTPGAMPENLSTLSRLTLISTDHIDRMQVSALDEG